MSKWKGLILVFVLSWAFGAPGFAQDTPDTATPSGDDDVAKVPGGIYVYAGFGKSSADPFNSSIQTSNVHFAESSTEIDESTLGRAALGWKMPSDKGHFRVVFNGFKEDSYTFDSQGLNNRIGGSLIATDSVPWWNVRVRDGVLTSVRTPPVWDASQFEIDPDTMQVRRDDDFCAANPSLCQDNCVLLDGNGDGIADQPGDDANCDGQANGAEIRFPTSDPTYSRGVPQSLENQIQTVDLVYGREFGGRRFSSRWWAGLRYFEYDGHMLGGAWLWTEGTGFGFTDGSLLRPLVMAQNADGAGPTGSWEVDVNFFNKGVQLFFRGQTALTFNTITVDSGPFFTLLRTGGSLEWLTAPARVQNSRDKSSWQNTAEIGGRVALRNGLGFEVGYSITGFLDVVLLPLDLTIPVSPVQVSEGSSALYSTQDFVLDGWHAGISYQF